MNLYLRLFLLGLRLRLPPCDRAAALAVTEARTPFRVLPTDLDTLMHVNNGRYLTLMDLAGTTCCTVRLLAGVRPPRLEVGPSWPRRPSRTSAP